MKSFIYLDTDTVNSYIAQIDNGLKTLQTQTSHLHQQKNSHPILQPLKEKLIFLFLEKALMRN